MQHESASVLTQVQAIKSALDLCMEKYADVILIGEGVPGPNGIFGTTSGLIDKYGPDRVFDMPLSENGMTGVCIGAALSGLRPVLIHQRIEFSLLAMDQLINNAAKWKYVFANQASVPLVIRMIAGTGSGEGAIDIHNLQNLFAHIAGLKVVMPTTPYDAKGMLISAIEDSNPVIFIEHRCLHDRQGSVPDDVYRVALDKAKVIREGTDITIATFSYMSSEAVHAAERLAEHGIEAEVLDMRSLRPLDIDTVKRSLAKTGRLLVADVGHLTNSIATELIGGIIETGFDSLKAAPVRFNARAFPSPTSIGNTELGIDITNSVLATFGQADIGVEVTKYSV